MRLRRGASTLIANVCCGWPCYTIGRKRALATCRERLRTILVSMPEGRLRHWPLQTSLAKLGPARRITKLSIAITNRDSLEARLVKAADVIDLLVQAFALEHAGAKGLDEFWEVANEPDFQLPTVAEEVVRELLQSLLRARRTSGTVN